MGDIQVQWMRSHLTPQQGAEALTFLLLSTVVMQKQTYSRPKRFRRHSGFLFYYPFQASGCCSEILEPFSVFFLPLVQDPDLDESQAQQLAPVALFSH
eukprot:4758138-Amphidinium_carterae.1